MSRYNSLMCHRGLVRLLPVLAGMVLLGVPLAGVAVTARLDGRMAQGRAVLTVTPGWAAVFDANFNGRAGTSPSAANWFYDIGNGSTFGTAEADQTVRSDRNVYVDGHGHPVLKATRNGGSWESARIETTRDDFQAPPGGRLEMTASIELPHASNALGYWPAFWAVGSPIRAGGTGRPPVRST
jgi:hypothetical protein